MILWPEHLNCICCFGFDRKYLPVVKYAVENNHISYYEDEEALVPYEMEEYRFTFLRCKWAVTLLDEEVVGVELVKGNIPKTMDLTAYMLKV